MDGSILTTIKKLVGIADMDESFDADLIVHINTYLRRLNQLGVGKRSFRITDKSQKWSDFVLPGQETFDQAIDYVFIRCKLIFDPPTNGSAVKALEDSYKEIEWLLCADVESEVLENEPQESEA